MGQRELGARLSRALAVLRRKLSFGPVDWASCGQDGDGAAWAGCSAEPGVGGHEGAVERLGQCPYVAS